MKSTSSKISRFRNSISAQSIRNGLTLAIPFLIMGSFSLLLGNFPNEAYQSFLEHFLDGAAASLFETLYTVSLGSLALVLTITISLSYGLLAQTDTFPLYPVVSVCSYLALCGGIEEHDEYVFKAEWVFTAMCITLLSCILFQWMLKLGSRLRKLHATGTEYLFNISIQSLMPVIIIIVGFGITGYVLRTAWGSSNITNFGSYIFLKIFDQISGNLFGILLYVVVTHVLWFFGIHGTNTLEAVSQKLFEQNISVNQSLMLAGDVPTEIFSKTFLDTFVFLGGCGCALSFIIALCIRSRKSHNRKIAYKDDLYLSVNISSKQMEEDGFFDKSLGIIESYDLERVHPVMEITERSAMVISDTLMQDMGRLKSSGISFSLDDFGMGHNSILYLQERIFDEVKLDGKLVSQLPDNGRSKDILSGIISMAHSLNLRVVAEFVETAVQRDMLLELGCSIYQGYYYSRPLSLTDLAGYMDRHR